MLYFGADYSPTDIDPPPLLCSWCDEAVARHDSGVVQGFISEDGMASIAYHRECLTRVQFGSLAHVLKRCSCYQECGDEDPPHMSKRDGARAVLGWLENFKPRTCK